MKKKFLHGLVLGLVMSVFPFIVGADDSSEVNKETLSREEVVVTATKTPKARGNITQQVEIIDSEEIEQMVLGNGNMAETVSHLPGAHVNVLARNQPNWGSVGGLGTNYNT